jgi:hypothetical protein
MTIRYLIKLKSKPFIWNLDAGSPYEKYENVGCTVEEVEALERKINRKFPHSYKEFLYLAGRETCLFGNGVDYCFDDLERIQEACKESLKEEGYTIEKDFWIFDSLHDEQFHFFYFGESEDPNIYHFCSICNDDKGYNNGIRKRSDSFSKWIHGLIPSPFYVFYCKAFDKIGMLFLKKRE